MSWIASIAGYERNFRQVHSKLQSKGAERYVYNLRCVLQYIKYRHAHRESHLVFCHPTTGLVRANGQSQSCPYPMPCEWSHRAGEGMSIEIEVKGRWWSEGKAARRDRSEIPSALRLFTKVYGSWSAAAAARARRPSSSSTTAPSPFTVRILPVIFAVL